MRAFPSVLPPLLRQPGAVAGFVEPGKDLLMYHLVQVSALFMGLSKMWSH